MIEGRRVLAIVPARSGSKGIPDKNMIELEGTTLIGLAGRCAAGAAWVDAAVLSTDSERYAEEGRRHGLDVPFLRPAELSGDRASALSVIRHALTEAEAAAGASFDVILLLEPTSPFRRPADLRAAAELLLERDADSVVSVSVIDTKCHPGKVFRLEAGRLAFYEARGAGVVARQQLERLYARNGVCYAFTRACVMDREALFTERTVPLVIDRLVVNIDGPTDVLWARFLLSRKDDGAPWIPC